MSSDQSERPRRTTARQSRRKRVLVVNAFFDEYRRTTGSPYRIPQAMAAPYLAGAFSPELCDVRIHNEQADGVLRDVALLGWPDMLVLTGLTTAFDRMRQLTAYARTLNPNVVVVAGGSAVRVLPVRSRRIFDYACLGDIEELREIAADVLGAAYAAEAMFPRFDLMNLRGPVAYVESSRYCNFRCSFCSLTAEGRPYQKYDLDYIHRQIFAAPKKQIVFIDNNFYGNDRKFFLARVQLLRDLYRMKRITGWGALVTGDFFTRQENLSLARESGCHTLFSGVESLDHETLLSYNKRHNTLAPQLETIRACLEAGINFAYGIMLDPSSRTLDGLRREIEYIIDVPDITLPSYFTLSIPMLGTPYFRECVDRQLLLPNVRLRHLDGVTLVMKPLDQIDEVIAFVRDLLNLRGYRRRVARHALAFLRRYRGTLSANQLYVAMMSAALICTATIATSRRPFQRRERQTFLGTTETLDSQYTPSIRLAAKYEEYFRPTMVTDAAGSLAEDIVEDLTVARSVPANAPVFAAARSALG